LQLLCHLNASHEADLCENDVLDERWCVAHPRIDTGTR
jgi:hypothetical protein